MKCSNRFHISKTRLLEDKVFVGVFHNNVYLLTCQSASLQSAFCHTSLSTSALRRSMCIQRGGGRGGTPSFGLDVYVPLNGVWFSGVLTLKQGTILLLSFLNGVHAIGPEALRSSVKTGRLGSTCAVCDQEPLSKIKREYSFSLAKIYWSYLQLSKHYGDKEDAVCEIEASIQTGLLEKSRLRTPLSRQRGPHKIRVVSIQWSTV